MFLYTAPTVGWPIGPSFRYSDATEMRVGGPRRRTKRAANAHQSGHRVQPSGPKPILRGADIEICRPLRKVTDEEGLAGQDHTYVYFFVRMLRTLLPYLCCVPEASFFSVRRSYIAVVCGIAVIRGVLIGILMSTSVISLKRNDEKSILPSYLLEI